MVLQCNSLVNFELQLVTMTKDSKFWFVLLIPLLLFPACAEKPVSDAWMETWDMDKEIAEEIEILYSDSAKVRVRITGPQMDYVADRSNPVQEFPKGVFVEFFDDEMLVGSTLRGNFAQRFENKSLIVVRDSVVWQSREGEKLESEELIWDEQEQRVYTQKFARITRQDEVIYGYGFEATQNFKDARIKAVTGRIKIKDVEPDGAGTAPAEGSQNILE